MSTVLIVDDEQVIRDALREYLAAHKFKVVEAGTCKAALRIFRYDRPDAVLLDLKMPHIGGLECLQQMKEIRKETPVIILTAYGEIGIAVKAIKLGALDFIIKPPAFKTLAITLANAIKGTKDGDGRNMPSPAVKGTLEARMGASPVIKSVIESIHSVSPTDFSVVIYGETGTGKTFISKVIHDLSKRAAKPFIKVDTGILPENLIESELFGHEKGAFTGAVRKKKGFFELAHEGSIFIDELQNMSTSLQSKLLSAVDEKRIYTLGGSNPIDIDVRIISATNMNLSESVMTAKIREDLFFRLNEYNIYLPPLRDRTEDIPYLAGMFLMETAAELGKQVSDMNQEALDVLMSYRWPGNVRELKNVMKRAVLGAKGTMVKKENLDFMTQEAGIPKKCIAITSLKQMKEKAVREVEKHAIEQALRAAKGNKTKAATMLKIDYKTLYTKIKHYGLE